MIFQKLGTPNGLRMSKGGKIRYTGGCFRCSKYQGQVLKNPDTDTVDGSEIC